MTQTRRGRFLFAAAVGYNLFFGIQAVALAGEEPEHRHLTYALAIAAGFPPENAKMIADADWSMDKNDSTTARRGTGVEDALAIVSAAHQVVTDSNYAARLLNDKDDALDKLVFSPNGKLARIGSAAFIHALLKDPRERADETKRPGLDSAYQEYIRGQVENLRKAGMSDKEVKRLHLIFIGQYMHELVDAFVHPEDPLFGHAKQWSFPDKALGNEEKYTQAAVKELAALRSFLREIAPTAKPRLELSSPEKQHDFCQNLVAGIALGEMPGAAISGQTAVEGLMNKALQAEGDALRITIPEFDKITFTPGGTDFEITSGDERRRIGVIESFVAWIVRNPEYADLTASVRRQMRQWVCHAFIKFLTEERERLIKYEKMLEGALAQHSANELRELRLQLLEQNHTIAQVESAELASRMEETRWRQDQQRLSAVGPPQFDARPVEVVRGPTRNETANNARQSSSSNRGERSGGSRSSGTSGRGSSIDWGAVERRINGVLGR